VNVQTNDGKARFACADGFRLAVAEIRADGPDVELILPRKIAKEIVKLLERATEPVALVFDGAQGRLKVSWADIYFPSINGTFPDPEQEITKEWRTRVTVNATDFRRKIKSAHVWAQDNVYSVRIRIEDGAIEVTAWEGQYKASCPANIEGEPNRIAFTGKHLLGALKGVDGDIVFEMTDEDSPGLFRLSNGFIHVIMPMSGVQW
jgi:DNA polymerase III sliding clamp (beta) subunit (PCNA family)